MNPKNVQRHIDTINSLNLEKLRTELLHYVRVCNESPSAPDGYPRQHIGAEAPSGRAPSKNPEEADLNSVEAAADPNRRQLRDDIDMKTHAAYHALAQAADALVYARDKMTEARNLQAAVPEPAKAECTIMRQRADVFIESAHKTDFATVLPKPLPEAIHVSAWVYKFTRANGVLPTREQCKAYAAGRRVMVAA